MAKTRARCWEAAVARPPHRSVRPRCPNPAVITASAAMAGRRQTARPAVGTARRARSGAATGVPTPCSPGPMVGQMTRRASSIIEHRARWRAGRGAVERRL